MTSRNHDTLIGRLYRVESEGQQKEGRREGAEHDSIEISRGLLRIIIILVVENYCAY